MKSFKPNYETLSRNELKNILGGDGEPPVGDNCNTAPCPAGEMCCPFQNILGNIFFSCETGVAGPDGHTLVCPA